MKEIKEKKKKEKKRERIRRGFWLFFIPIAWFFVLNTYYKIFQFGGNTGWRFYYLLNIFIFMVIWEFANYGIFLLKINSLKYYIDEKESRLLSSWKVILKHKDTAKLQVINSVDINQDIWDKFVDLYRVDICYGFSQSGYRYSFSYLSESDAEELLDKIKPSGGGKIQIG